MASKYLLTSGSSLPAREGRVFSGSGPAEIIT